MRKPHHTALIPSIRSTSPPTRLFESGSILLHLAEKFDAFVPKEHPARAETLNWLFWQMGAAPFLGGGFGHFYAYAPEKLEYPIDRFAMEVKRQLDVLDRNLAERRFLVGDEYTIADIATWPWYGVLVQDTSTRPTSSSTSPRTGTSSAGRKRSGTGER